MKMLKNLLILLTGGVCLTLFSCKNWDIDFPDYEGGVSVYFPYQYPVRTIVLGEDNYDTSLDNQHKCKIYATMGGAYEGRDIKLDIAVDNTLCDNLFFEDGSSVLPMPENYYSLADNKIYFNGEHQGGVEVQLTDAFFADPAALKNTYVIPVVIKNQTGADRILSGVPLIEGDTPVRTNSSYWDVKPMDYVLYCVKYINPYHAYYLRRGIDKITENGKTTTVVRHQPNVEKDEICSTTTQTLNSVIFPVTVKHVDEAGTPTDLTCNLLLTFNEKGECAITSASSQYTATGSGKYLKDSEKLAWGNKDRDGLYLDYQIDFKVKQVATKDTLVWQRRGVVPEEFTPKYVE
ncbi:DUF5627 domain-containing protein [uncultured Mediterranea sp.]|uniref:DUF5627 domain-containing protein n=1 Tax=uncultured Mediterranea sp. TaxID=1926662 RepID=UPI0027D9BB2C|nr:DUF5627 domain-containing protein [uncultured Mediterranea sp.]